MINLLPLHIKEERSYGRRNRMLLSYSLTLVITAGVIAGIMIGSVQLVGSDETDLRADIDQTNTEILALERTIKEVEKVATRLETAKDVSELSVKFSELIPKIGAVLPSGVILNALSLTGGITDPLRLDVDIVSADLAPVLSRNLVESDLFEAADITSLTPKGASEDDDEAPTGYNFTASVTASFTGSNELKAEQARKAKAKEKAQSEAISEQENAQ